LKTRTKKCFNCKEEFTPFNTLQKFCLKNECIKAMVEIQKLKEWNKKKKRMVEDLKTANDYLKIAQQVFNKFIRVRDKGLNCISPATNLVKKKTQDTTTHKADIQT
jgi:hypothetical protein